MLFDQLPKSIADIYNAYERDGTRLVQESVIYLCTVQEIVENHYLKMLRPRDKALAPGKVRNKTDQDVEAGQKKWDAIYLTMREVGYDYRQPISFIIRKSNKKRKLSDGHHRVTIAKELDIAQVSVSFAFE